MDKSGCRLMPFQGQIKHKILLGKHIDATKQH